MTAETCITRADLPETLYAVLVCRTDDSVTLNVVDASPDRDAVAGKDRKPIGPSGYYTIVPRNLPDSIRTLGKKFGNRVDFGHDPDGRPGCWIDGKPHRLEMEIERDWMGEESITAILGWTWTGAEAEYIEALIAYRKSQPSN